MARAQRRRADRLSVEDLVRRARAMRDGRPDSVVAPVKAVSDPDEHRLLLERRAREAASAQLRAGAWIRWIAGVVAGAVVAVSLVLLATMPHSAPPRQAALSSVPLLPATTPPRRPVPAEPATAVTPPSTSSTPAPTPTPTPARSSVAQPPVVPVADRCPNPRTARLNDDAPGIGYDGPWKVSRNRGFGDFADDVHFTTTDGASVRFSFTGTGIALFSETNGDEGRIDIYVDGTFRRTVDASAATRTAQQAVFSTCGLPPGSHDLRAVKRGGQYLLVDRIDVTP
ncbi:hypothetical protein [Amycolatopsis australiensis]|uniref:Uncharacterized protein n=1 Tax=Amycolatopsis australiensis TaxID=546364 RepID=A0A1K1T6D3_9PSEU|nr:hypothetical protein [Amycolatopsis australiensis]SFW92128.1 hypothetical protein SAMN04489730_8406 [Amycolatopsis australiensis]